MQMKTALLSLTAALLLATGLTGCGSGTTNEGMRANSIRNKGIQPYTTSRDGVMNRNYNANGVDGLTGANRGYGESNYGARPFGVDGTQYGHMYGNGSGFRDGMRSNNYDGAHMYGTGMTGHTGTGTATTHKVEMSKKIADKLTKINGVKSAHVLMSGNDAYVAVTTNNKSTMSVKSNTGGRRMTAHSTGTATDLSSELKNSITKEVKKVAPNCKNVYVSSDVNFVDRMTEFSNMAATGHPIRGLTTEFTDMVNRLFPTSGRMNMAPGTR